MRSTGASVAGGTNAQAVSDTVESAMTLAGYVRDEAGQWVSTGDNVPPSLVVSARGLPADWPRTNKVIRHRGQRKSKRAAAVEPAEQAGE